MIWKSSQEVIRRGVVGVWCRLSPALRALQRWSWISVLIARTRHPEAQEPHGTPETRSIKHRNGAACSPSKVLYSSCFSSVSSLFYFTTFDAGIVACFLCVPAKNATDHGVPNFSCPPTRNHGRPQTGKRKFWKKVRDRTDLCAPQRLLPELSFLFSLA